MSLETERLAIAPAGQPAQYLENIEDRRSLVRTIISQYVNHRGKTDWVRAFGEHPDWKVQLCGENDPGNLRLHAAYEYGREVKDPAGYEAQKLRARALARERYAKWGKKTKARKPERSFLPPRLGLVQDTPSEPPAPPQPAEEGVKHCPECGYNIAIHNAAAKVARRHSNGK